jgi:hypothetical protein
MPTENYPAETQVPSIGPRAALEGKAARINAPNAPFAISYYPLGRVGALGRQCFERRERRAG